ncbi:MAG: class I SAM-dependent methyltransferase [Bryobacteraceae bacterium]|nr:class I SAM-dependent methyltransferase [Bryobacteraceae bacterium]
MLRLHPLPPPEELRKYYPDTYWFAPGQSVAARLEEAYRSLVLRDHVNFVESALTRAGPDGVVLDIGCGGALFGKLLRARGHACVGLDNSAQAARVGWSVNQVPVVVGDFLNSPFAAESFRAITMFHVLEHLYNPVQALRAIGCLLRPGGRLIVQVPNVSSWQFRLLGAGWNGIDVPRHLVNFRAQDLNRALERAGYEVLRHKYFSLRDNPAGLASSLAPGLDPMARRVRKVQEGPAGRLTKDLAYLGLVGASVLPTMIEAMFHAGSTVMVEARKVAGSA